MKWQVAPIITNAEDKGTSRSLMAVMEGTLAEGSRNSACFAPSETDMG